jgi:paraquat-inducible protein A
MACPSCDQLYDMSGLEHREKARCGTCNHLLATYRKHANAHVVAFSISGLIFFVLACHYPFMSFKSSGMESVMTLPQVITQIKGEGMWNLAMLVAGFILIIPALVMVLTAALGVSLLAGWRNYWAKDVAKLIFHLQRWSMVEVFFIGVLVSFFKIAHMATVGIGVAFWSYAAFAIFFTLTLSNLDTFYTWKRLEELEP